MGGKCSTTEPFLLLVQCSYKLILNKGVLVAYNVAMVTYSVEKTTITSLPMIRLLFDIIIVVYIN